MGQKLPPDEMQLYQRVDEVLYYIWDPIGVSTSPCARTEYYSYLPVVYSMLKSTDDGKDIKDYLSLIETEHMGLGIRIGMEKRLNQVADTLLEYRNQIIPACRKSGSSGKFRHKRPLKLDGEPRFPKPLL